MSGFLIAEVEERHIKARQMVSDLCQGRREWIMRIPAEPDYDPDLVIAACLADIPRLIATIKAYEFMNADKSGYALNSLDLGYRIAKAKEAEAE